MICKACNKDMNERSFMPYQRKQKKPKCNKCVRSTCNSYEKTKNGFVMRMYRNMKSRVEGVQWRKAHLYEGLELMPKKEFYELALNDPYFNDLFEEYENSGYDRKLAPTPDRVDSGRGYTSDNIDFVTHSVNSRNGANSRWT